MAQEADGHVSPRYRALHHDQRLREGQTPHGVDQHIGERSDRTKPGRWQQQPCVVDGMVTHCCLPLVVDVPKNRRLHAREVVVRRGAGTGQQFPVPQYGNQVRGRRREGVKSPVRLQDASTYCPSEGGVVNSQPGKGRTAGRSATACQCICDIHSPMLVLPVGVQHPESALCGELEVSINVTSGTLLAPLRTAGRAQSRFLRGYGRERLPAVTSRDTAASL